MRRELRDEIFRGFLSINTLLREELRRARAELETREAKYNPNWRLQPRAPRGTVDGGQWTKEGGGPKQQEITRPRPAPPLQRPESGGPRPARRVSTTSPNEQARIQSLPLSLLRVSPLALALPLYGDTPRPRITRHHVPGTNDLLVVVHEDRQTNEQTAYFTRIVRHERDVPLIAFGIDTGLRTIEPAETQPLDVEVVIEADDVSFDGARLAAAYGREIPGVTNEQAITSHYLPATTPEERLLDFNLRRLGATQEQVGLALQQLRSTDVDGESFAAHLRARGAGRDRIRSIRRELRLARSRQPYRPPSSGRLLDVFPGLAMARGSIVVRPAPNWLGKDTAIVGNERRVRRLADELVAEIRAFNANYEPLTFNDPANFPRTIDGRQIYIDWLRAERAAARMQATGRVEDFQIETLRFLQRQVDRAYAESVAKFEKGELSGLNPNQAIGTDMDGAVRQGMRDFFENLLVVENDDIAINRAAHIARRLFRRPDVRIGDIFFECR